MMILNNNFTTQEQSSMLLKLGVPEDSSDCYLHKDISRNDWEVDILKRDYKYQSNICRAYTDYLPCWSVGRLIEIYVYLTSYEYVSIIFKKTFTPMDKILDKLEKDIANGRLDFSKLKE